jgi:ribosomal protein S18 acetylase RimI-like enzyme
MTLTEPPISEAHPLTIELAEHPSEADLGLIVSGVRSFNRNTAGHEPPRPVGCFLRDSTGQVVGGVQGDLWGRSVHIAALWIAESHRGQGHAAALLRELEGIAEGCTFYFLRKDLGPAAVGPTTE